MIERDAAALFHQPSPDQAHGLRVLAAQRRGDERPRPLTESTRVIAVTSGKGGVGKTNVVVNLAVLLQRWGKQVIILDCDLGTANVDVMLGMHPRYNLQHVLSRQRRLDEVMSTGPHGIRVISGGSGLNELANLSGGRREELLAAFASLEGQADILLLDTGAGISANVLRFVVAAGEAIVVTTPEPTAVTDAYALIKVASQHVALNSGDPTAPPASPDEALRLRLVVNQAISEAEARETATNIATVARRFLGVTIDHFGSVPIDRSVSQAVRSQVPVVDAFPRSAAAQAIERLARQLLASDPAQEALRAPARAAAAGNGAHDGASGAIVAGTRSLNGAVGEGARPAADLFGSRPAPIPAETDTPEHPSGRLAQSDPGYEAGTAGSMKGIGMFVQRMFAIARGKAVG